MTHSFFQSNTSSFKQVVLIPFPHPRSYCLGIITADAPSTCQGNEELVSLFIPTTPNPMTGFLTMAPKKNLIYLDMKGDEALKYIISCAVILPSATSRKGGS
jgi:uncharacterized membrane protein